jgi:hypothetical protein
VVRFGFHGAAPVRNASRFRSPALWSGNQCLGQLRRNYGTRNLCQLALPEVEAIESKLDTVTLRLPDERAMLKSPNLAPAFNGFSPLHGVA